MENFMKKSFLKTSFLFLVISALSACSSHSNKVGGSNNTNPPTQDPSRQWRCEVMAGEGFVGDNDPCYGRPTYDPNYPYNMGHSAGAQQSKDVELARSRQKNALLEDRSQQFAQAYQMNLESARQLVQLSDQMSALESQGKLTDDDRIALADSALAVAGISGEEVSQAMAKMMKDQDKAAVNALVEKAAVNLGMTSSAGLRDQILPALGLDIR